MSVPDQTMLFMIAAAIGAPSMPVAVRLVFQAVIFCLGIFVWINP